jgi:E3 ubiquitin-protein ligase HUWE1
VQAHKGVLNLLVLSRPSVLDSSLQALIRCPQLRSALCFENKRRFFFAQLKARRGGERSRRLGLGLQLRRDQLFEDSFNQLRMRSAEEMRGRLQISFRGEEGVDAGGLTREWYIVISREIFNPNYALFTSLDGSTFQPWSQSSINTNHLDYFRFVGRVIGKAVCDQQLMDAHFTRSFYKHVIGMAVDYTDIEATDPEYFKSLKQILEFSLDDLGLELSFSAETQTFGRLETLDLIPGGRHIAVTDDNKGEYVKLMAKHRMTNSIRAQIDSFLDGFYDLVPPELISIFSPTELELLICGLPDVDVEDLCCNTDYHNFQPADPAIQHFWEVLRGLSQEDRALFLQFVTGTSKVGRRLLLFSSLLFSSLLFSSLLFPSLLFSSFSFSSLLCPFSPPLSPPSSTF